MMSLAKPIVMAAKTRGARMIWTILLAPNLSTKEPAVNIVMILVAPNIM